MSKPAPTPTTITGSCLCGSTKYTVTGSPRGTVLCHCSNCQKTTGSTFANNLRVVKSKLTFTSGKDKVKCHKDSNTKSGNELSRYFCGDCGSPLYLTNPQFEGLVILYTGNVDTDAKHERPKAVLFDDNRRKWFGGVEGASKL
ncbi:hypothetical protein LTR40_010817 [Exophiala xenobiotica]|nr:hypothetical protein LTR40_010817 [Exophiala xenobiotica]